MSANEGRFALFIFYSSFSAEYLVCDMKSCCISEYARITMAQARKDPDWKKHHVI
jgi:hypothetical protein